MDSLFAREDLEEWERDALEELKNVSPKYPYDEEKDLEMLRLLKADFPQVDFIQEIRAWRVWILDNAPKKDWNWRSRLRRWIKNSERYSRQDGQRIPRRYDAAPREAFTGSSEAEVW